MRHRLCRRRSAAPSRALSAFAFAFGIALCAEESTPAADANSDSFTPGISATPERFILDGAVAERRIIVTGADAANSTVRDLTAVARFVSSDESVVKIDRHGIARPTGNGKATVRIEYGDHQCHVQVEVRRVRVRQPPSFKFDVLAILSKHGCSQGACHGSPSGKGGFRLSLRGFDPELDRYTLLKEFDARRLSRTNPASSLLLLKPTQAVPHEGGVQLRKSDRGYQLLYDWIAAGAPVEEDSGRQCIEIELWPSKARVLATSNARQRFSVVARFSDGSSRDVTSLTIFSVSDDTVGTINQDGELTGHRRGDVAVIARYLEHVASTRVTLVDPSDQSPLPTMPALNYIDEIVDAKLHQLGIVPSGMCDDATFVRRVYLDSIGVLPTPSEVEQFVASTDRSKRNKLIDSLLERPEHASFWALKWGDLLRLTSARVGDEGVHKYHRWLESAFRRNLPYDEFARQLLASSGSTLEVPTANYYRVAGDPQEVMEATSQVFLGSRLQCAKCHNHPFERWTQDNYYGMAAFFGRVTRKESSRAGATIIWENRDGEVIHPRTGKPARPWAPGYEPPSSTKGEDTRRQAFARWLTAPDNPFFARVEANRLWAHVMGRGIVEPPDDFRISNPASIPALLDALAEDFAASGFDRRHILGTILKSRTYQSVSTPTTNGDPSGKYFASYRTRLLGAEQLLEAISSVLDVPHDLGHLPLGSRAIRLPAPDALSETEGNAFLKIFGQTQRQTVCECERSGDARIGQALQLYNGNLVHSKLRHADSRLRQLERAGRTNREIVTRLYLAAYSRPPRDEELSTNLRYVESQADRLQALEDVAWAVLNSQEFLFQR